jgi:PKD repeat protein
MATNPGNGFAGDSLLFTVRLTNNGPTALNVTTQVRFGWEDQAWFWGTVTIDPNATAVNTFTKTLTSTTGDYTVRIFLSGSEPSSGEETGFCNTQTRQFQVMDYREPSVAITARPTTGQVPLAVDFNLKISGGAPPFNVTWAFGDGNTGAGDDVGHTYQDPGAFLAQAIAIDSRGALAVDRIPISATSADASDSGGGSLPMPSVPALLVALVLASFGTLRHVQNKK